MTTTLDTYVKAISDAFVHQAAASLILQAQFFSLERQPVWDLAIPNQLTQNLFEDLERALFTSRHRSRRFFESLLPQTLSFIARSSSHFTLQEQALLALRGVSGMQEGLQLLRFLVEDSTDHVHRLRSLMDGFADLQSGLTQDKAIVDRLMMDVMVAFNADQDTHRAVQKRVAELDGRITSLAVQAAFDALRANGNDLQVVVATSGTVVAYDRPFHLVFGGWALVATGSADRTRISLEMARLTDERGELLTKDPGFGPELSILTALSFNLARLLSDVQAARTASGEAANAWRMMTNHLTQLHDHVQRGALDIQSLLQHEIDPTRDVRALTVGNLQLLATSVAHVRTRFVDGLTVHQAVEEEVERASGSGARSHQG